MCDCEPAEVYVETYRKARKPRHCCECAVLIGKGDVYQYTSGIIDHRPFSDSTCLECSQIRDHYVANLPWGACWPPLGLLFEEWPRGGLPPHVIEAQYAWQEARKEQP